MVKVIFYNLLRSKYKVNEMEVHAGPIVDIIEQILFTYPKMEHRDFETCVVFHQGKPVHHQQFSRIIDDGEEIIITHFVGGG